MWCRSQKFIVSGEISRTTIYASPVGPGIILWQVLATIRDISVRAALHVIVETDDEHAGVARMQGRVQPEAVEQNDEGVQRSAWVAPGHHQT